MAGQTAPTTSCRQKCETTSVKPQKFIQTRCPKHTHLTVCVCVGDRGREGDEFLLFFYLTSPFCTLSKKTSFAAEWVFARMEGKKATKIH